jgi:hypothetical protein
VRLIFSGLVASLALFAQVQPAAPPPGPPQPITPAQRFEWFAANTAGPASLVGGVISSGFGSWMHRPEEYGTHWDGFGKRYGLRLTGIVTSNAMEAGIGGIWGEDPRYERALDQRFSVRVAHIVKMTFLARYSDGRVRPAYARYVALTASNYLSNTWRPDSAATPPAAAVRVGLGFLGRMGSNAFLEFWPDVRERVFRQKRSSDPGAP